MNDQLMTRRDVVALFASVFLVFSTLTRLLGSLDLIVLARLPFLASSRSGQVFNVYTVILDLTPLLLVPFVSLIAVSVTGRRAGEVATLRACLCSVGLGQTGVDETRIQSGLSQRLERRAMASGGACSS